MDFALQSVQKEELVLAPLNFEKVECFSVHINIITTYKYL